MNTLNPIESGLSQYLFWDTDIDALHWDTSASFIIKRVLEYGLWSDWKIISNHYGVQFIANKVMTFRELEPKAINFIANLSDTNLSEYRCYSTTRSKNQHWNF